MLEMPHTGHPARLVERHSHHVEAAGLLAKPPRREVPEREPDEPRALPGIHRGLGRIA